MTDQDYIDHFKYLGENYLKTNEIKEMKLSNESFEYLEKVHQRLKKNNEIILSKEEEFSFHIIKSNTPFLFSLPGQNYFFSTGLFLKYLKSEELFVSALGAEVLKSNKKIYEKKTLIPLGFVSTEKMLNLTRLNFETRSHVDEWTYIILKRAGYDASAYLNWIQVQNRNSLDFSMYLGETLNIVNEERVFKNYMSKQGILGFEKKIAESNSSKKYYNLLKDINKEENETRTIRKNTR